MDISGIQPFVQPVIGMLREINVALIDSWWLTIAAGALLCFFGIRIFGASAFWFAALVGAVVGFGIGASLLGLIGGTVGALVLGVAFGYLLRAVARIGVLLCGVLAGGLIATSFLGNSLWVIPVILASGILSVVFFKTFIMVITSVWGAILLTDCMARLLPALGQYAYAALAVKGVLCIAGLTYQSGHLKVPEEEH